MLHHFFPIQFHPLLHFGFLKYFECYKYDISDSVSINVDTASFRSVIFTEGCGTIRVGEDVKAYKAGDSFYITAGNKTVEIEGNGVAIVTKV